MAKPLCPLCGKPVGKSGWQISPQLHADGWVDPSCWECQHAGEWVHPLCFEKKEAEPSEIQELGGR